MSKTSNEIAISPERFLNRELSQISFNQRVLEESGNKLNPLLERIKFLSISASNMDEFYMVRVAGLKYKVRTNNTAPSTDGLTPKQQLEKIDEKVKNLNRLQEKYWDEICKELEQQKIEILLESDLSAEDKLWLKYYFTNNIYPVLTPIAIDPAHPFPFLPNLSIALILHLERDKQTRTKIRMQEKDFNAVIPIPNNFQRFIKLPAKEDSHRFIMLENVIEIFYETLFPGCKLISTGLLKITRDSDLEKIQDAEDLVSSFESALKRRRRGLIIRLKVTNMADDLLNFVSDQFSFPLEEIAKVEGKGILGLSKISELYDAVDRPDLKFPPLNIRFPERVNDYGGDCFAAIHAKDIIVHHPYESFDVVVQFIRQAARDPDVVAIKQTLYRTSNDSPIVRALIDAAEAGKTVTALVELKARFDEEANLKWAKNLERAGVQVIFGFVNLKTHAKISLVVKRVGETLQSYVHYGTGNYHPVTAKVYSDLSFFTSDAALCRDASHVFNYLTGYSPPEKFEKISIAPISLRKRIIELINEEIAHVEAGKKGHIWLKVNSLVDEEIIEALYKASAAGVNIEIIARGICCLRPGIKGLSENIKVKSIVGRFLEHSRIFCFGNGKNLPSPEAKVFMSSADLMLRNLDWRVEILIPIENATVHEQVLSQIMLANIKDEKNSWILNSDGVYERLKFKETSFSAHEFFIKNPSLSGRGTALHGKKK